MHRRHTILLPFFFACVATLHAQAPAFYHLSTAEGLSDNFVNSVCRDKNGILWIGTTEGLNSFDGNRITTFYKNDEPRLGDNNVMQVSCDDNDRIWVRTSASWVSMLDDKRAFNPISIGDTSDKGAINHIVQTKRWGPIVIKGTKHYVTDENRKGHFRQMGWKGDTVIPRSIRFSDRFDDDKIIYCGNDRLLLVDYSMMAVVLNIPFRRIDGAAKINDRELLVYTDTGRTFYRVDIVQKKIIREYSNLRDQYNQLLKGDYRYICRIDENRFAVTTRFSGVYQIDIGRDTAQRWHHDPIDQRSIGGDNTFTIHYDTSGYIFITTLTSGLHYFNTRQPQAGYNSYFIDEHSSLFDGFIQAINIDKEGIVWLGTQDRLIRWDRKANKSSFINYQLPGGRVLDKETVRALWSDDKRLWMGTTRYGIVVLENNKTIRQYKDNMPGGESLPSNWINSFCPDSAGRLWVATLRGICMIDLESGGVSNFSKHPVLSALRGQLCNTLWLDKTGRLWIGTNNGAWCYSENSQTIQHYNTANGLTHDRVLSFNEDVDGNIYAGTMGGLTVISNNRITDKYTRSNGLRNDKCEGILRDENGFLWIGNLNCILRFDPRTKKYAVFEEGFGFSHAGFRMRSCYRDRNGEMFWGSDKGLTWFFPMQMNTLAKQLRPSITALHTADSSYRFTGHETLHFPYNTSSLVFHFTAGELSGSKKIQFRYQLEGFDKNWYAPSLYGQVAYNRLPPGEYHFLVKASRDGNNWYEATYPVTISIATPWWRQAWFRLLCLGIAISLLYIVYRYRQQRKQSIEIRNMINSFASSGYEKASVNDILWDICRNCIALLRFEDCVIYLPHDERKVLVQKAAFGPKSPGSQEIVNPIEIPFGKGIVGDVALTGSAAIVNDTTKDKRYIVDDERRLSEITVPIVHEGKVIGIIDSEHRKKNFFTKKHLQALQTIASLCSAKISRAMALEAMQQSRIQVMELNMKIAESKFLNLRLQMNPHFLFNSLSSIQHLIVSGQTNKAYRYLTVFSNFLRSLLTYAERNFIPLDEELKILKMYIELESLRFDQSFQYDISVDDTLSNEEILIPTLLLQPFAENAIWHGLLHKQGDQRLLVSFANNADDYLTCTIEDNGIGRLKSADIRQNNLSAKVHESKGISIVRERLKLLQQKTGKPADVAIEDLYDHQNKSAGTKVIITIPYYNHEEL